MITVKYLASLADELNKSSETLSASDNLRVIDVWQQLNPQTPIKANTVCAVDFAYAQLEDTVSAGAEVAFFPPVTGG